MQTGLLGKIVTILGALALLWALIMTLKIVPQGALFQVTPNGALDGAATLFLLALACFLWPEPPHHPAE